MIRHLFKNAVAILIGIIMLIVAVCLSLLRKDATTSTSPEVGVITLQPAGGGTIPIGKVETIHYIDDAVFVVDSNTMKLIAPGSKHLKGSHTLEVPKSYAYMVKLPDGSSVRLNSASRLKIPSTFGSDKREVELDGEGYFDIAPNAMQVFTIHCNKADILVLGTTLNVNTYDSTVHIALVSGSAMVISKEKKRQLTPGNAAMVYKYNGELSIKPFHKELVLGWLEGKYLSAGKSLREITGVIERWYNITIIIDDKELAWQHYSGAILKNQPLRTFLENLKAMNNIDYFIDNKGRVHLKKGDLNDHGE